MTKFDKLSFEEIEQQKKIIAEKIYNSAFLSGFQKLTKIQLLILVNELVDRFDYLINIESCSIDYRDFKDVSWDQKCLVVETLCPNFFDK